MKNKITKDYCIGLDIGTGSVGWAVVDDDYKIMRLYGKDAWGALLIDNAESAKARRLKRGMRRRYERRRERIRLLQDIFAPMITPIDENFFLRLKESSLHVGEGKFFRNNHYNIFDGKYNIFDGKFTDKNYFKNYPTIYHLRHKLATQSEPDIRLVYLALHHIVKYRGHFLREGDAKDIVEGGIEQSLEDLFTLLKDNYLTDIPCDTQVIEDLSKILKCNDKNRTVKQEELVERLPKEYKTFATALAKALLGNKFILSNLFSFTDDVSEGLREVSFSFSDSDYEEMEEEYFALAANKQDVLAAVKSAYSTLALSEILRGKGSLSEAMTERYEKHKKDLRILKGIFRKYFSHDEYKRFFRSGKEINYVRYVGDKRYDGYFEAIKEGNNKYSGKISRDVFYKSLRKRFEKIEHPDEQTQYCLNEMAKGDFLPLINSVENSYIPYQLNLAEMEKIIENQGDYYPQLRQEKDKIVSILTFRRPYYVGPLKGPYSWNEQQIEGRITPWNFYDKVDTDKLAENFIVRMTNRCTIFPDQECLPKNSITWQKYVILNALNKLSVTNRTTNVQHTVSVQQKQAIFDELCLNKRKVTKAQIAKLLKYKFNIDCTKEDIGGLSSDALDVGMTSYIDFKQRLGATFDEGLLDEYEESIRTLTIFDDTNLRKKRLKAQNVYTDNQVESLCKLKYSGWGSFSRKVLRDTRSHKGENIMQLLYEGNKNFQELRYDKSLGFLEAFEPKNTENKKPIDLVKDMRCSPIVKKIVWNAIRILEEITSVTGKPPKAIFLENTQEDAPKKKTDSRTKQLKELYNTVKNSEYFNKEAAEFLEQQDDLSGDAFYLWLLQLGRCMYTGEAIPLDQLKQGNFQIDHIVPQCYIKDDSLGNRVLIKTSDNANKTGTLGTHPGIIQRMRKFWEFLHEKKFISDKKLRSLMKTNYDENDQKGFIDRQLVDTSYAIKEIQNVLKQCYLQTEIRGIRAGLISTMRQKYRGKYAGFYKIRGLNNFHHAKDAYLTAVLGMFTTYAFPLWGNSSENKYYKDSLVNATSQDQVKDLVNKRYGYILDLMSSTDYSRFHVDENGNCSWSEARFNNIFKTMAKNSCLVVKKQEPVAEAEFYNQNIISPKDKSAKVEKLRPLKISDGIPMPTNLYGGYASVNPAYFVIMQRTDKKGKSKLVFGSIPTVEVIANNTDKYISEEYGDVENGVTAKVLRRIKKYQLVEYDGQLCYISGQKDLQNAVELYVTPKYEELLWLADAKKQAQTAKRSTEKYLKAYEKESAKMDALLCEFVDYYCDKLTKHYPFYKNFAETLQKQKDKLLQFEIKEKLDLLSKMMIVTSSGPGRITLDKELGGGSFGRIQKTLSPDKATFIDLSLTGLHCKTSSFNEVLK